MDSKKTPFMFPLTLLVLTLGVIMLDSAQGLDLNHLNKRCQLTRDSKFPSVISVSLNITGQSMPAGPDVRRRSLSPWDYSIDEEPNRYPSRIAIAKCRHQRCVDADGELMDSGNSVEIRQEILVLYREMKDCKPTYRLQKKLITVGCTCVRPIIQHLM
ncbi:interleukin-17A-like [Pelobates fuscus]|uniref:interleukin-17A-like n=1 Tax=Pelobates fuscus TaxID=191477 RepID=UPI002FE4DA28